MKLLPGAVAQLQQQIAQAERSATKAEPDRTAVRYPLSPGQIALTRQCPDVIAPCRHSVAQKREAVADCHRPGATARSEILRASKYRGRALRRRRGYPPPEPRRDEYAWRKSSGAAPHNAELQVRITVRNGYEAPIIPLTEGMDPSVRRKGSSAVTRLCNSSRTGGFGLIGACSGPNAERTRGAKPKPARHEAPNRRAPL